MYELVTDRVLRNLCDDPATTPGAGALNKYTTILLVLNRAEKSDVRLIAGVTPSVFAYGLLVDLIPDEEVPLNSHMAPNA